MIMYFLVILPLPTIDFVKELTTPFTQLKPFQFIIDFLNSSGFVLNDFSTYLRALKDPTCYTVLFNIFLFVPLGIYLRYYFKCSFLKTITICFGISLFFELTQLSGLYGIYPRPYRLFDVDDLMINTLGGLVGYFITPILYIFLPSRDKLDELSYEKGKRVSHFRRLVGFCIDLFLVFFINMTVYLFGLNWNLIFFIITVIIYYIFIPWLTSGRTIGKFVVQLKITSLDKERPKFYQYIIRNGLLYFVILPTPVYIIKIFNKCSTLPWYFQIVCLIVIVVLVIFYIKFCIQLFLSVVTKENKMFYEQYSKTQNTSTILYVPEEIIEEEPKKRYKVKDDIEC